MQLYMELARLFMATEASPLVLGGVEFWIDADGPWAGQLTFSKSTSQWNPQAMGKDVADLARCYPVVGRIVSRYAEVVQ